MEIIAMVASVPAVIAVVNVLKEFGVAGKWATLAAIATGIALNVANYYFAAYGLYQALATGLMLGLAAAGVYDVTRTDETVGVAGRIRSYTD